MLVFIVFGGKTLALMLVTPGGGNLNYRHNGMLYVHICDPSWEKGGSGPFWTI